MNEAAHTGSCGGVDYVRCGRAVMLIERNTAGTVFADDPYEMNHRVAALTCPQASIRVEYVAARYLVGTRGIDLAFAAASNQEPDVVAFFLDVPPQARTDISRASRKENFHLWKVTFLPRIISRVLAAARHKRDSFPYLA